MEEDYPVAFTHYNCEALSEPVNFIRIVGIDENFMKGTYSKHFYTTEMVDPLSIGLNGDASPVDILYKLSRMEKEKDEYIYFDPFGVLNNDANVGYSFPT